MDPVVGKVVASAGKAVAQKALTEPDKVLSGVAKVLLVIVISIALFVMIVLSSLLGCLDGADLSSASFNPEDAEKYRDIAEDYEAFMDDLFELMETRKEELLQENTETIQEQISVWVDGYWEIIEITPENLGDSNNNSGSVIALYGPSVDYPVLNGTGGKPNLPPLSGGGSNGNSTLPAIEKQWVDGYWDTQTVTRDVSTARTIVEQQEIDISLVMAYITITEEGVLKKWYSFLIPDDSVKKFLMEVTFIQENERELSEEEKSQAVGDDKYITKEITVYNEIFSLHDILAQYFPEESVKRESFKLSYRLYQSFMNRYQETTNE